MAQRLFRGGSNWLVVNALRTVLTLSLTLLRPPGDSTCVWVSSTLTFPSPVESRESFPEARIGARSLSESQEDLSTKEKKRRMQWF